LTDISHCVILCCAKIVLEKSGSFRTIVVFKKSHLAIFVYGFAKSEKDNLDNDELQYFKILAKDLLKISTQKYSELEKLGTFVRIKE